MAPYLTCLSSIPEVVTTPGRVDDSFDDLFDDALREPVIDVFVKLRYRLVAIPRQALCTICLPKRDRDLGLSFSVFRSEA